MIQNNLRRPSWWALLTSWGVKKLDKKAQKFRFIGYTDTTDNYEVWDEVGQEGVQEEQPPP